jgi:hypothetical protein
VRESHRMTNSSGANDGCTDTDITILYAHIEVIGTWGLRSNVLSSSDTLKPVECSCIGG